MQIQIRHIPGTSGDKPQFVVMREGKSTQDPVALIPPSEVMVGTYNTNLQKDLRWYLEKYLDMPIEPYSARAGEIQKALSHWGRDCFDKLFGGNRARDWYQDARQQDLSGLRLKIASDDPAVLCWPWEALESGDDGLLAIQCSIERQLDKIGDICPLVDALPRDQLNILYIIARPYGDADVGFRTFARPLIDFVDSGGWPVHIDLLRPPSFDRLRTILEEKPNFYHIVHFDGHGRFGEISTQSGYSGLTAVHEKLNAPTGTLVFEKDDAGHSDDPIQADMLGELLRKYNIPVVVLNACQSAMLDEQAKDPYAAVATTLLKAGTRSVVAMSYSLWVSGAKEFVPAFYQSLFMNKDMALAMQAGRKEMYRNQMRDTFNGKVAFHDWVVPALYQQEDGFLPKLTPGQKQQGLLPHEARDLGDYGFIGRDRAIQKLERLIRAKPTGILIHGMAGEGKTTLAKGFLKWLQGTHGIGMGAFWFSFEDIRSAGYIIDMLANELFGTQAMALPTEQKLDAVTQVLRDNLFFIVWDNFESASGIPGIEGSAMLSDNDQSLLKGFLKGLRGGKTKVLITSRSQESWLSAQECNHLPLEGLEGEELWQYCNAIVSEFGSALDREDETYKNLMDKLEGNPLAIRSILLRLRENTTGELLNELERNFQGLEGDDATKRIQAALSVFERGLDRSFEPALRLIGLHEHYAGAGFIGYMLAQIGGSATPVKSCFTALESAGLCRAIGIDTYQIHPALRDCLNRLHPANEADKRAFVNVMGSLTDAYADLQLHEQKGVFTLFSANFHRALKLAWELNMRYEVLALLWGLAVYAEKSRNYSEAERLYIQNTEAAKEYGNASVEAAAYGQLGTIALERRDFFVAEERHRQALEVFLALGNDACVAIAYHQLGMVAQERRDFDAAEEWYKQSLAITLKLGDEHGAAQTYHNLGAVVQERRDFDAAEEWYKQSLAITLKLGDEHGAAQSYGQLGNVALERRDFDAAEEWYKQSLAITLKLGDEYGAATTYHQLGNVAKGRRDFDAAEEWYKQSLAIVLKLGDGYGAAQTYHQLGMVAQERRDFDAAEEWYKQSLAIKLKQGNEHGAATTFHQLGVVAQEWRDFDAAEEWYKQSLAIKLKQGNEHGAAQTYHQLGRVAEEQQDFETAEELYGQALATFIRLNDPYSAEIVKNSLARLDAKKKEADPNDHH